MVKRYKYITPEDYKVAKENGINRNALLQRVRIMKWDIDRAITEPIRVNKRFTDEEIENINKNGLNRRTVTARINYYGWSREEATTTPTLPKKGPKRSRRFKYTDEIVEKAKENGICYSTFTNRVNKLHWTIKKAATTPIRRKNK